MEVILWAGENGVSGVPGPVLVVPPDVRFKMVRVVWTVGSGDLRDDAPDASEPLDCWWESEV